MLRSLSVIGLSVVLATLLFGCGGTTPTPQPPAKRTFESPTKTRYTIQTEPDDADTDEVEPTPPGSPAAKAGGDFYTGKARKVAKISLSDAKTEEFADLADLMTTLISDSVMKSKSISTKSDSARVAEENRNVKVKCWLYAASRENDNDFHLILGREPGKMPEMYMTMELSGLPPMSSPFHEQLKNARTAFKTFFGTDLPGSSYDFYTPAIPVEIEGSLFWDASHETGSKPGPARLRPKMPTIWEVHPISRISFEP